jgi:hypothetical protein
MSEQLENEMTMSTQEFREALLADLEDSKQVISELSAEELEAITGGMGPSESGSHTVNVGYQPTSVEEHVRRMGLQVDAQQQAASADKWKTAKHIATAVAVTTCCIGGAFALYTHLAPAGGHAEFPNPINVTGGPGKFNGTTHP